MALRFDEVFMETIRLPASIEELTTINARIEDILKDKPELIFKTQLVVEEILTNITKYAYANTNEEKYLRFVCGYVFFDCKKTVLLQLVYGGDVFDPFVEVKSPDINVPIEDRDIGGLGLHLIREIADHYTYARIDDANQVQIYLDAVPSEE